jgi:5-methylcytosine-specific restriction endonuclease McrA
MPSSYRSRPKTRWPKKAEQQKPVEEVIKELRQNVSASAGGYRERSLKIHGLLCAKCGREFDHTTRHLLTVHHKDGNHHNNPADGSNWENLCVYCHDDEHSRGLLGDYLSRPDAPETK